MGRAIVVLALGLSFGATASAQPTRDDWFRRFYGPPLPELTRAYIDAQKTLRETRRQEERQEKLQAIYREVGSTLERERQRLLVQKRIDALPGRVKRKVAALKERRRVDRRVFIRVCHRGGSVDDCRGLLEETAWLGEEVARLEAGDYWFWEGWTY